MSARHDGAGGVRPGPPPGTVPSGAGYGVGPHGVSGHGRYQPGLQSKGLFAASVVVALLVMTAVVVNIVALVRSSSVVPVAAVPATTSPTVEAPADNTEATRALCQAIGPLMVEAGQVSNTYSRLGPPESPARKAATPKFVSDTTGWADRVQVVLEQNLDADPFLRRTLQRLIDDRRLFVIGVDAGPMQTYDAAVWDDNLAAYNGPLSTCWPLGVTW